MQQIGFDLSGLAGNVLRRVWLLQRSYNWQLIMPHDIRGLIGILVSQYCQEVRFGDYSITEISSIRYGPYRRFYAGLQEINTVTLSFLVPVDNSVTSYFYGWHELIVDKEGYYHPKNNYKRDIYVMLYDRTGIESVKFKLKGTFPRTKPRFTLSYDSESVSILTIDMSVDSIEPTSFIGSITEGVSSIVGSVASKTKDMLGSIGRKPLSSRQWAGLNTTPGLNKTPTTGGTFFA